MASNEDHNERLLVASFHQLLAALSQRYDDLHRLNAKLMFENKQLVNQGLDGLRQESTSATNHSADTGVDIEALSVADEERRHVSQKVYLAASMGELESDQERQDVACCGDLQAGYVGVHLPSAPAPKPPRNTFYKKLDKLEDSVDKLMQIANDTSRTGIQRKKTAYQAAKTRPLSESGDIGNEGRSKSGTSLNKSRFGVDWDGAPNSQGSRADGSSASAIAYVVDQTLRWYRETLFDSVSGLIIFLYMILLGLETEFTARSISDHTQALFIVHMVFNAYFILELCMRCGLDGAKTFFCGNDVRYNMLDLILCISSVVDVILGDSAVMDESSTRILRSIRVMRVARTLRIVHAMSEMREFQKMVTAITSSLKTLACSITILFFFVYLFSLIFTYAAIDARRIDPPIQDLDEYWGTFTLSLYSLFISVSGGQSWYYVVRPLFKYSTPFTLLFIAYILITVFGVLNVIASIFVESAITSAQHIKELIVLDKEHEKSIAKNHMKRLFQAIDGDGNGEISVEEMEYFLTNDELQKYMNALQLSAEDTRMLFRLLDTDGSNRVDIDEFCEGCLRLKGEARSMDVHVLLMQVKGFLVKWSDFTGFVEERFQRVDNALDAVLGDGSVIMGSLSSRSSMLGFRGVATEKSMGRIGIRQSYFTHNEQHNVPRSRSHSRTPSVRISSE